MAQTQTSPSPSQPESQSTTPAIRSVQIVDVKQLKPDVRSQVEALIARTSDKDMQSLRKSIDSSPSISSALKEKGLSSAQVVAINIDKQGVLTMFTKSAA